MTKEEAKAVLQRNNYCPTHGIPMTEHKQTCYGWGNDWTYYTCSACEMAMKNAKEVEIREALKTLGLRYPGQIVEY